MGERLEATAVAVVVWAVPGGAANAAIGAGFVNVIAAAGSHVEFVVAVDAAAASVSILLVTFIATLVVVAFAAIASVVVVVIVGVGDEAVAVVVVSAMMTAAASDGVVSLHLLVECLFHGGNDGLFGVHGHC